MLILVRMMRFIYYGSEVIEMLLSTALVLCALAQVDARVDENSRLLHLSPAAAGNVAAADCVRACSRHGLYLASATNV